MTISNSIIEGKMARYEAELDTWQAVTGQVFETLPLGLGDTSLKREVFPDGGKGEIGVCTQETSFSGAATIYRHYVLHEGRLIPDPNYYGEMSGAANLLEDEYTVDDSLEKASKVRKALLLAKVVFGRPDHWERDGEFEEEVEEG